MKILSKNSFKFQVQNLSFNFNTNYLLLNISCTFNSGTIFFIKGTNGSGKTTLLRLLVGLEKVKPNIGHLIWNLKVLITKKSFYIHKDRVSYLNINNSLNKVLTVYETLIVWGFIYKTAGFILPIILKLNLISLLQSKISVLSFGQLRLVNFALIILKGVPFWVLDEPLIGLDNLKINLIETVLNSHKLEGGSILVASHTNFFFLNSSVNCII